MEDSGRLREKEEKVWEIPPKSLQRLDGCWVRVFAASRRVPSGRPGARRMGHQVGLPSRVSGMWEVLGEEGRAARLRAACVSACRASLAFWDMIPQGLAGGEVSPLCHHPGHEKLGFSRWNKARTPGLEGWHIEEWFVGVSESKQGQEGAERGLGRDGDPPALPGRGVRQRTRRSLLRVGICTLSTGMTQHLHTRH